MSSLVQLAQIRDLSRPFCAILAVIIPTLAMDQTQVETGSEWPGVILTLIF